MQPASGRFDKSIGKILPGSASTQSWMFLTLAGFVGLAVLLVGLYVFVVLRAEVTDALNDTLLQRSQRIALIKVILRTNG